MPSNMCTFYSSAVLNSFFDIKWIHCRHYKVVNSTVRSLHWAVVHWNLHRSATPPHCSATRSGRVEFKQHHCWERIGRGTKKKVAIWPFPLLNNCLLSGNNWNTISNPVFYSSRGRRWEWIHELRSDWMFLTFKSFANSSKNVLDVTRSSMLKWGEVSEKYADMGLLMFRSSTDCRVCEKPLVS